MKHLLIKGHSTASAIRKYIEKENFSFFILYFSFIYGLAGSILF